MPTQLSAPLTWGRRAVLAAAMIATALACSAAFSAAPAEASSHCTLLTQPPYPHSNNLGYDYVYGKAGLKSTYTNQSYCSNKGKAHSRLQQYKSGGWKTVASAEGSVGYGGTKTVIAKKGCGLFRGSAKLFRVKGWVVYYHWGTHSYKTYGPKYSASRWVGC